MSALPWRLERWDQLPRAISQLQAAGAHHRAVPLQALYRGLIAHCEITRTTSALPVKQFIAEARRPALFLIGDDDDTPTGPSEWQQANRLLRWARHVIVHAAGARVDEYHDAVAATLLIGRVLMIETASAHAEAWRLAAFTAQPEQSVLVLLPADGLHPAQRTREKMQ